MERVPIIVSVKPLNNVTFSQWLSLNRCPLKGSLRAAVIDGELPKPPPTRASLVGTFHHTAMELVVRAKSPEETRLALENEVAKVQRIVSASPHLRRLGSVSGWDEINRSISLAEELACSRIGATKASTHRAVETDLRSASALLAGRPDFFSVDGTVAQLREYKSGGIRDDDGNLLSEYLEQVKFYSCLIVENFEVATIKASVESLSGDRCEVMIDRPEARQFGASVETSVKEFNIGIQGATSPEILAKPSREACAFCSGRVACLPFKKSQDRLELEGEQYIVQGPLVGLEAKRAGHVAMIQDVCRDKRSELRLPQSISRLLSLGSAYLFFNLGRQGAALTWAHTSEVLVCA